MAGNPNPLGRKADKVVRDALLAALRQKPERLKKAAEAVWDKAEQGDLASFKEIADRLDGRVAQPIADDVDNPFGASLLQIAREINGRSSGIPEAEG